MYRTSRKIDALTGTVFKTFGSAIQIEHKKRNFLTTYWSKIPQNMKLIFVFVLFLLFSFLMVLNFTIDNMHGPYFRFWEVTFFGQFKRETDVGLFLCSKTNMGWIRKGNKYSIPCGGSDGGGTMVGADLGRRAPSEARLQLARRPLMIGVATSQAFLAASASLNVT